HHGAVDVEMVTTGAPSEVMKAVREALGRMGLELYVESEYKYRCIRPNGLLAVDSSSDVLYGDIPTEDAGDEVRFSVELTRLDRLEGTYSLDIRRLKGNLRSYKFVYDTVR
ncbi:hypothetical protein FISHEDRAFT_25825, partial [Fistulina hepatica ATCC 64428]